MLLYVVVEKGQQIVIEILIGLGVDMFIFNFVKMVFVYLVVDLGFLELLCVSFVNGFYLLLGYEFLFYLMYVFVFFFIDYFD